MSQKTSRGESSMFCGRSNIAFHFPVAIDRVTDEAKWVGRTHFKRTGSKQGKRREVWTIRMGGGPVSPGRRDEVVLITGCSDGGIGSALATEFCSNGFTVVATSRSVSTMKQFEGHDSIELLPLDLLSEESVKQAVDSVMSMYGRIDILVNNAGIPCTSPLAETPIQVIDKVYRTNCLGMSTLRSINCERMWMF